MLKAATDCLASSATIAQSYSLALEQTFTFPLRRLENLAVQAEANRLAVRGLAEALGTPDARYSDGKGPVWTDISVQRVLESSETIVLTGSRMVAPGLGSFVAAWSSRKFR